MDVAVDVRHPDVLAHRDGNPSGRAASVGGISSTEVGGPAGVSCVLCKLRDPAGVVFFGLLYEPDVRRRPALVADPRVPGVGVAGIDGPDTSELDTQVPVDSFVLRGGHIGAGSSLFLGSEPFAISSDAMHDGMVHTARASSHYLR